MLTRLVASLVVLLAASARAQVPYEEAISGLGSKDPKVRLRSATLLKEAGYVESAIPLANLTLRVATRDDSPKVRVEALYAFGTLASQATGKARRDLLESSLADLIPMLTLPDPALRVAAVRVIGRIYERRPGDGEIEPQLADAVINAVNEKNADVKLAAMDTLGALRDARAVEGLTRLLQFFGKNDLGLSALSALARIGDTSSVPVFASQLSGKTPPAFRAAAIEGLARTGNASHIPAIQDAVNRERDERVFYAGDFAAAMLINGSIERLVGALNRPKLHDAVRQYLVELTPGRTARLARYAQDPEPRMRIDIADIVGLAGDPDGSAVVGPLLNDKDPDVAVAARRAMARLNADR